MTQDYCDVITAYILINTVNQLEVNTLYLKLCDLIELGININVIF